MKKIAVCLFSFLFIISCAESKIINGKLYEPYGWANYNSVKDENIIYDVSVGNVVLSLIFSETIIVPVILTGWSLYNPIKYKENKNGKDK